MAASEKSSDRETPSLRYVRAEEGSTELPPAVFKAELEAIAKRRSGLEVALPGVGETDDEPEPSVERGLVGLALSGGGIRSATFSLGVMRRLAKDDLLRFVDYLSTVSGGGYIGSSLTWLVSGASRAGFGVRPKDFPYGVDDPTGATTPNASPEQQAMLKYLREHGNYLTPGAGITLMSGIAIVLRGMLLNLLVWLPILVATMVILLGIPELAVDSREELKVDTRLFGWLLWLAAIAAIVFVVACVIYSLLTYFARGFRVSRYLKRRLFEKWIRWPLCLIILLVLVGTLPIVEKMLALEVARAGGVGSLLLGLASGVWGFFKSGQEGKGKIPLGLVVWVGAALFLYGLVLTAYFVALWYFDAQSFPWLPRILAAFLGLAVVTGLFVNLNYISIHRYYRDRLMEAFMPSPDKALANETGPAREADRCRLHDVLDRQAPGGAYHLVNTNLVLVDSGCRRWRMRGGDNFVLAPDYCGGSATGWRPTKQFMSNGMTLATAMAISGAAANPNTGVGGVGPARNPLVSLFMALLNLRLGYWIPNPEPTKEPKLFFRPNHFDSAWCEILPNGYRETNRMLQLSDGGHFENLGLYELLRRRLKLIIVCDGAADPGFAFGDLQIAVRRARQDFGVRIDFAAKGDHPKDLIPTIDAGYPQSAECAERGHIVGTITYADGTTGTLIYLKTTLIEDLSLQTLGYKGRNPDFPDQSTADQFFDEEQFEAYRELGFAIAARMIERAGLRAQGGGLELVPPRRPEDRSDT